MIIRNLCIPQRRWKKSYLYKNTLGKEIYIDKNGYNNPAGVNWAGAIGDERIGDTLPLEYDPSATPTDVNGTADEKTEAKIK